MITYIKYFFLCFYSFLLTKKLLNLTIRKKNLINYVLISASLTIVLVFYKRFFINSWFILIIFTYIISSCLISREKTYPTIIASLISFAFSYCFYLVSLVIIIPFGFILLPLVKNKLLYDYFSIILSVIIQAIILYFIFKLKRLKHGMPFLFQKRTNDVGILISISTIFMILSVYFNKSSDFLILISALLIIFLGCLLIIWWKKMLTTSYIEKVNLRNIEVLENTISNQELEIEKLKIENQELSKIIHKDNKLIPAMEMSVTKLIELYQSNAFSIEKASKIYDQLKSISSERLGILNSFEQQAKLVSTNVTSIDNLIYYMYQKALQYDIQFDVIVNGSIKYMVESIISENEINTVLADLIDNAIIATTNEKNKYILINIGTNSKCYYLEIFDSGIPFQSDTLLKLGITPATTHKDLGGSGIGLITTYEIIKKYQASIEIDEEIVNELYTKKVSIYFDYLSEYRIKTNRQDVIKVCNKRSEISLI